MPLGQPVDRSQFESPTQTWDEATQQWVDPVTRKRVQYAAPSNYVDLALGAASQIPIIGDVIGKLDPGKGAEQQAAAYREAQAQAQAMSDLQWSRQMQGLQGALGHVGNSQSLWNSVYGGNKQTPTTVPTGPMLSDFLGKGQNGGPLIPFNPSGQLAAAKNPNFGGVTASGSVPGQARPTGLGDVSGAVDRYTSGLSTPPPQQPNAASAQTFAVPPAAQAPPIVAPNRTSTAALDNYLSQAQPQPPPAAPAPMPMPQQAPPPALTQGLASYLGSSAPQEPQMPSMGLAQALGVQPMTSSLLKRRF